MNIKKIIAAVMAVLTAILVSVALTSCGSCNGDVQDDPEETIGDAFEVGGTVNGVEIEIPKEEQ